MRMRLEYGRTGLEIELPDDRTVHTLRYKEVPPLPDPAAALREVLAHPRGTPPLEELARGRKSGKPFVMLRCVQDGRHYRAFINHRPYVEEVLNRLESRHNHNPGGYR